MCDSCDKAQTKYNRELEKAFKAYTAARDAQVKGYAHTYWLAKANAKTNFLESTRACKEPKAKVRQARLGE